MGKGVGARWPKRSLHWLSSPKKHQIWQLPTQKKHLYKNEKSGEWSQYLTLIHIIETCIEEGKKDDLGLPTPPSLAPKKWPHGSVERESVFLEKKELSDCGTLHSNSVLPTTGRTQPTPTDGVFRLSLAREELLIPVSGTWVLASLATTG